jgi:hypothetical protein
MHLHLEQNRESEMGRALMLRERRTGVLSASTSGPLLGSDAAHDTAMPQSMMMAQSTLPEQHYQSVVIPIPNNSGIRKNTQDDSYTASSLPGIPPVAATNSIDAKNMNRDSRALHRLSLHLHPVASTPLSVLMEAAGIPDLGTAASAVENDNAINSHHATDKQDTTVKSPANGLVDSTIAEPVEANPSTSASHSTENPFTDTNSEIITNNQNSVNTGYYNSVNEQQSQPSTVNYEPPHNSYIYSDPYRLSQILYLDPSAQQQLLQQDQQQQQAYYYYTLSQIYQQQQQQQQQPPQNPEQQQQPQQWEYPAYMSHRPQSANEITVEAGQMIRLEQTYENGYVAFGFSQTKTKTKQKKRKKHSLTFSQS